MRCNRNENDNQNENEDGNENNNILFDKRLSFDVDIIPYTAKAYRHAK